MSDINDWIHDDICWCVNECKNKDCERNSVNRRVKVGLYTAAMLKDTEYCPLKPADETKEGVKE